jgi:hypothetical protein
MREFRPYGSVRGACGDMRPYRDKSRESGEFTEQKELGRFARCLIGHKREVPYSFSVALRAAPCSSVYGVLLS